MASGALGLWHGVEARRSRDAGGAARWALGAGVLLPGSKRTGGDGRRAEARRAVPV